MATIAQDAECNNQEQNTKSDTSSQNTNNEGPHAESRLLPQHRAMLEASAISAEVIAARGYFSATKKTELKELGFTDAQCRVPAFVFPVHDVNGEIALYQIRPDNPRMGKNGKPIKYETPRQVKMTLDVPPAVRADLGKRDRPLFITEGIKKADSAVSHGLCCLALLGVWSWRGTNDEDGKTILAAWESITLEGRDVYIGFDSDVALKPEVHQALGRLKGFLESRKALVRVIYLDPKTDGSKVGLDDFFAAKGVLATLLAQATETLRKGPDPEHAFPYRENALGLLWLKDTREGRVEVPLCNFTARITSECQEDDGVETRHTFDICVKQGERTATVRIPWEKFNSVNWAIEALGASAVLVPGPLVRDHVRAATQLLSQGAPRRKLYTHLGWRKIGEQWVYLHAEGALGASGNVSGVEVAVPAPLARYVLPEPLSGEELRTAIQASLRLLTGAPLRVIAATYCAVFRAPLGGCDFAVHLAGQTGNGKTELAVLAVRHYGASFTARHLPAAWSSTGNSLEGLAFLAKDTLLLVDDFCPTGSANDIQRIHREADRILRAQGNLAGRLRMKADATLRPAKAPRGLILSTGEDIPKGHSLRARTHISEVTQGDVKWDVLTQCQEDSAKGLYAQCLSAFIQWVALRYEQIQARVKANTEAWRLTIASEHKRTADILASLAAGFDVFLTFARAAGAISEEGKATLWRDVWQALLLSSGAQEQLHADSDPALRFIELLTSALSSGRAHLAGLGGGEPGEAAHWGWATTFLANGETVTKPRGEQIGWTALEDVYLDPDASYAVAQRLQRDQNESLPITAQTLRKRLKEKGYLASVDAARETATIRKVLEDKTRQVLHLKKDVFSEGLYPQKKPDIPDIPPQNDGEHPQGSGSAPEKPDIADPEPDIPDIDLTDESKDKSNSYPQNVGNVRFFEGVESPKQQTKTRGLFDEKEGKNDVGNGRFPQKENPTEANENPTFAEEEAEWER